MQEVLQIESLIPDENPKIGQSRPIMIIASDHQKYLLKRQEVRVPVQSSQGNVLSWITEDAVFFQEALVSKLSKEFGIICPDTATISIDSETLQIFPELRFSFHMSEGTYFATKVVSEIDSEVTRFARVILDQIRAGLPYSKKSWNTLMSNITNKNDVPKIITLDLLTGNYDRFPNPGNILIKLDGNSRLLLAIDFGHCFGGACWNDPKTLKPNRKVAFVQSNKMEKVNAVSVKRLALQQLLTYNISKDSSKLDLGIVFDSFTKLLNFNNSNPFNDSISMIESLNQAKLIQIVKDIPEEWIVSDGLSRAV